MEIKINLECISCSHPSDLDDLEGYECNECVMKETIETVKDSIREIVKNKAWEDEEFYVGFENDHDKKMFLKGLKRGIHEALFSIGDYLGQIEFIEDILCWKDKND